TGGVDVHGTAELAALKVPNLTLDGAAVVNATVYGPIDQPLVYGRLETAGATLFAPEMKAPVTLDAAATFKDRRFQIENLEARWGEAVATVTGGGNLDGSGKFAFRVRNLHPDQILDESPVSGTIELSGEAAFSTPKLDSINATARFDTLDINAGGLDLHQQQ